MPSVKEELIRYGKKIYAAHLVVGCGGNISARDDRIVWMKPSGFAMDDGSVDDLCGLELATGKQIEGPHKPTSEVNMHLAVYGVRPEINGVFHTHSPWLCGVVSSGVETDKTVMFPECVNDLGRRITVPYTTPTTRDLAGVVAEAAREHETIFMTNHGVCCLGVTLKQAFYRCLVAEDAAISLVAASVVGTPRLLTPQQEKDLMSLSAPRHRVKVVEK